MSGGVMRYLSVCSGIEAATVAWHPLGWQPVAFAEVEPFPSAVLAHHYGSNLPGEEHARNGVPNWGDMTKWEEWPDADVDVLVGGTPCQDFSIAGLRAGLAGDRGNLALAYLAIARRYRPRWLVWENVPGVLSSNGGRDFGTILRGMVECGYGVAYRVLDAQYIRVEPHPFAVPQRRRRVIVVAHLGDWRRAAAVLFERESLSGHPPPRRRAGEDHTVNVAPSLRARGNSAHRLDMEALCASTGNVAHCPNAGGMGRQDFETETLVAHSLRAEGFDAGEDGTGRGTPIVPVAHVDSMPTMQSGGPAESSHSQRSGDMRDQYVVPVAFSCKDYGADAGEVSPTLRSMNHDGSHANAGGQVAVATGWSVRRLMPVECERLQGFPDGYTRVPYRCRAADRCPDGPRYKALGNSMAVNKMRWLGERIQMVEAMP